MREPRAAAPAASGDAPGDTADAGRLTIRAATVEDLDTVVAFRIALLREHGANPLYARLRRDAPERARPIFAAQLASTHETTFLALDGARAVGILRCVESLGSPLLAPPRYCYVSSVYVVPDARRHGVLRALAARAEQWCRERGLDELRLHSTPDNPSASAAWEALGFAVVEQLRMRRLSGGSREQGTGSSPN